MENLLNVHPRGILLIIGGKESKGDNPANHAVPENYEPLELLRKYADLVEDKNAGIEIVTSASLKYSDTIFSDYKKIFNELGIDKVGHIYHKERKEVLENNLTDRLKTTGGIFFTGGNQLLLTSLYGGTQFLKEIKNKFINERVVIGGTSAGAMAMSTLMICAGSKEVQQLGGAIRNTTGLEFLKNTCIDTHFVHRGRFTRLAQVVATNPSCIGLGIEEDTALIVSNGIDIEVAGSGVVIVMEGFNISHTNVEDYSSKVPISIRDLTLHIFSRGDKYILQTPN